MLPKFTPPKNPDQPEDLRLSLVTDDGVRLHSTVIDVALAKNLDKDGLLKLKALEYTLQFLSNRQSSVETIEKIFNTFHKQITNNGTEKN